MGVLMNSGRPQLTSQEEDTFDILKWLKQKGCVWNEGILGGAARGGYLEVVMVERARMCLE